MNRKRILMVLLTALSTTAVWGSGFSLYEPSTVSHAMGGALVGKAMDASANFNNPATLTDLTNVQVTVGFVTEHPRAQVRGCLNGRNLGEDQCVDPGLFWLPHLQMAVPLPWDFTFGLGFTPEYGLGTKYDDNSALAWNARETTVQGYVINPNLAYKITDKWSLGVGMRWLYFDFDQYKNPTTSYGTMDYHLNGNNRFESLGWQIGTKYDILDNLSAGIVYKSPINVNVRGDSEVSTRSPYLIQTAGAMNGAADSHFALPQSLTAGINWDVVKTWHLGLAVSWTQWSDFDMLRFHVQPKANDTKLNWNDTWRGSIGSRWEFIEDWSWMISYTFDMDCSLDESQESVMLPPAHRNIVATGFTWNCWRGLELAISYSCIFMDGGSMNFDDSYGNDWHVETCRGFCHAAGFSVTYRF